MMAFQAPRWLRSASAMARRSRRTDSGSWSFATSSLASLVLLGLVVVAYRSYWQASFLGPAQQDLPVDTNLLPTLSSDSSPFQSGSDDSGVPIRKALVLASYKKQNVSWLQDLKDFTQGWHVYRYMADDPDTTDYYTVANPNGREALAYLTYIIDHYDALPEFVVFIHGHKYAWHQPEHIVDKLSALNLTAVADEKYVSLRCQLVHGCNDDDMYFFTPDKINEGGNAKGHYQVKIGTFWKQYLEKELGPVPDKIGRRCCSQFAVSRDAILARSLKFWKRIRSPLLIEGGWHHKHRHMMGLYFEMVWHMLMGKPAVHCPAKDHCIKVYFQDLIQCVGDDERFKAGGGTRGKGWKHVNCTNSLRNGEEPP